MTTAATNKTLTEEFEENIQRIPLRVECGIAFGIKGSIPTAQLFTQNERGRFVKAGPFVAPPEDGDRADLFTHLAFMWRQATGEQPANTRIESAETLAGEPVWHVWDRDDERRTLLAVIRMGEGGPSLHIEPLVNHAWTPGELEQVAMFVRGLRQQTCTRCGKRVSWDQGDSAWSDADRYNLICVEGANEDGSDALGHVVP